MDHANVALIGNGCYSTVGTQIADDFATRGIGVAFIEPYSIPVDRRRLARDLADVPHILTVEENMCAGGLGSYILELLSDFRLNIPVTRMGLHMENGVPHVFMNRAYLRKQQSLDAENIAANIERIVEGQ